MKYYVNGKEISKEEAEQIKAENDKYFNSGNMNDLLKIKFIAEIKQKGGTYEILRYTQERKTLFPI